MSQKNFANIFPMKYGEKSQLTMHTLKKLSKNSIHYCGITFDMPTGLNIDNSGRKIKWIMCVGEVGDWCVYYDYATDVGFKGEDLLNIHKFGQKIRDRRNVENLFIINDSVWELYRY